MTKGHQLDIPLVNVWMRIDFITMLFRIKLTILDLIKIGMRA